MHRLENKIELNMAAYDNVANEARNLAIEKNHEYGNKDLKAMNGAVPIVRIMSKVNRVENMLSQRLRGETIDVVARTNSIEDDLLDIINYANYAILVMRGEIDRPTSG